MGALISRRRVMSMRRGGEGTVVDRSEWAARTI